MLELEGKSFVYPSLPQKVNDKPVGARIPTGFYRILQNLQDSCTQNFCPGCFHSGDWRCERRGKGKILMNISYGASADFLVP